jgi:hypothetical protein
MSNEPEITVRPKIEVGQQWVTVNKGIARVLATDGKRFGYPVVAELDNGLLYCVTDLGFAPMLSEEASQLDFVSLAPQTVKREVALYQSLGERNGFVCEYYPQFEPPVEGDDRRISEPLTIEFTLLPGESA